MMKKSAPTLHDVARRAGVSTAIVSRALNIPALVKESTREFVLRTVVEDVYSLGGGRRAAGGARAPAFSPSGRDRAR